MTLPLHPSLPPSLLDPESSGRTKGMKTRGRTRRSRERDMSEIRGGRGCRCREEQGRAGGRRKRCWWWWWKKRGTRTRTRTRMRR